MKSSSALVSTLILLSLVSGCTNLIKKVSGLSVLRNKIIAEYHEDVNVTLGKNSLVVTFINSSLNNQSAGDREKRAIQTADFVVRNYPAINEIHRIWIGFSKQENHFIVVHHFESLGFFGFDETGKPLAKPSPPPDPLEPTARYWNEYDATDVTIPRIELRERPDNDFSVMTQFTVKGDATGPHRSPAQPAEVRFNFTSNSDKSLFPGAPKLSFAVDEKVLFASNEQFSTSKFDEKFSETLLLSIPYPTFQRLVNGKRLTLKIADETYDFTPEQIAALRKMTTFVAE
jgi:hypothetical protein